jgi:SHS2 domain-containing protein
MAFEIIEGMTSADIAFKATGDDLPMLFGAGAHALASIMLQNPETIMPELSITFECAEESLEMLYFDFLHEFIFYKDSENLILLPQKIEIDESSDGYSLTCRAQGEKIDKKRHLFNIDIKAITLHKLLVKKERHGWSAIAVADV